MSLLEHLEHRDFYLSDDEDDNPTMNLHNLEKNIYVPRVPDIPVISKNDLEYDSDDNVPLLHLRERLLEEKRAEDKNHWEKNRLKIITMTPLKTTGG